MHFPTEVLPQILTKLDTSSLTNFKKVNKYWNYAISRELQNRSHTIVKKFKNINMSGFAIYGVNNVTGELSDNALAEDKIGVSHEELSKMNSILFDYESSIRAKLRGVRIESYSSYFTLLKEDSFMSKKATSTGLKADYVDFSPSKEILTTVTLIQQHKQNDEFRESTEVRQSFAISQCGSIVVFGRCEYRRGLRSLNSITCNIAENLV